MWADQYFIKLNESKPVSMKCTRVHDTNSLPLFLKRAHLAETKHQRHLGISLSSDGSWTHHVKNMCLKAMKHVDCLRGMELMLDRNRIDKLYFTFVRPIDIGIRRCHLGYLDSIQLRLLERIQLAVARCIIGATQNMAIRLLYDQTKWEPLCD